MVRVSHNISHWFAWDIMFMPFVSMHIIKTLIWSDEPAHKTRWPRGFPPRSSHMSPTISIDTASRMYTRSDWLVGLSYIPFYAMPCTCPIQLIPYGQRFERPASRPLVNASFEWDKCMGALWPRAT
jgi:hypothetical protein